MGRATHLLGEAVVVRPDGSAIATVPKMSFRRGTCAAILGLALAAAAEPADAQTTGRFALGGNVGHRTAADRSLRGATDLGLLWRLGHSHTGWHWSYGLGWFSTDLTLPVGGHDTELGELHVRPFMGGYGYTQVFGRTAVSANVNGGPAFVSFALTSAAHDAYRDQLGARSLSVDVGNTLVVKPTLGLWYDLSEKIGLNVSAGYTVARPKMTISSTAGDEVRRLHADMFSLKIGAVYSIF
jgi:hypothetical protein